MDNIRTWSENQSPAFAGRNKTSNTYKRLKDRSRSRGKRKAARSPVDPASPTWKPLEVKRCALQTLGGSSGNPSPAPLKGDVAYKVKSKEATLRKMKPYGGSTFFDKCYLSSEDEREADEEHSYSWALSPSDMDKAFSRRTAHPALKKNRLALYSASSSSSAGAKSTRARRACGEDPFAMPPVAEESDYEPGRDSNDEKEGLDWGVDTKATGGTRKPANPRARQVSTQTQKGAQRKAAKAKPMPQPGSMGMPGTTGSRSRSARSIPPSTREVRK